jgi:hypothetical protein
VIKKNNYLFYFLSFNDVFFLIIKHVFSNLKNFNLRFLKQGVGILMTSSSATDPDKLTRPIRRQIKGALIECLVKYEG